MLQDRPALIDRNTQLSHVRHLAIRRHDQDVLNFFFKASDYDYSEISNDYKILGSILRAVTARFEEYRDSSRPNADIEAVVDFTFRVLSQVEIPRKAYGSPEFREFITATVFWYRALRRSVYVSVFWNNMYDMLTMDLSALPDVRESIVGEVADIARATAVPKALEDIIIYYSERPYLFSEPKHYLRLVAYNLKCLILDADLNGISRKLLFAWIRYIAIVRISDKDQRNEIIAMKDEIHRGIGYLMRIMPILRGRYGGVSISVNLLLIKLEHVLVFRQGLGHKLFGVLTFWLLRWFWRAKYIQRKADSGAAKRPSSPSQGGARPRPQPLDIVHEPVYAAKEKAIIVTRVQGGLGDIIMMRPGLIELAARKPNVRVHFATNKSYFPAFSVDDPITLIDIENTKIDLSSFSRWHNFSYCPASRVEVREFPKPKTNRIDIFAHALGIHFPPFSRKRTRPFRFSEDHTNRALELIERHRRPGTLFIAVQYRSAETYRDAPAILDIARELAKVHTVFVLDHRPVPKRPDDGFIPITDQPLQVAMALVSMADFMVGPDSSMFHIAGANRVPGIALFGPTGGKVRTKAYPTIKALDMKEFMACVPCWRHEFAPCKVSGAYESICLKMLTTPIVMERADAMIKKIPKRNPTSSPVSPPVAPAALSVREPAEARPASRHQDDQVLMVPSTVLDAEARGSAWLLNSAWPLWFDRGVDWGRGGFYEKLDQDTAENTVNYKRLRVLTRQIYVFSEAVTFGWSEGRKAVDHGLAFLLERARQPDGGYAIRFDLSGTVIDDRRDLYDSAFVLFALARAFRITGDTDLRQAADDLVTYLEREMRHPAGGFVEGIPAVGPRRQNPHMHLLEALIACVENGWGEPFLGLGSELIALFVGRFYQPEPGVLPEYFEEALVPMADEQGRFIEPGHHYEWVWLLERWAHLNRTSSLPEVQPLYRFASDYGSVSPSDPVLDEIWLDGQPKARTSRLWPQTERLKACLALYERTGEERYAASARAAASVLERYLTEGRTSGLWSERLLADGTWSDEPAPASSLYHITMALAELRRVAYRVDPGQRLLPQIDPSATRLIDTFAAQVRG